MRCARETSTYNIWKRMNDIACQGIHIKSTVSTVTWERAHVKLSWTLTKKIEKNEQYACAKSMSEIMN